MYLKKKLEVSTDGLALWRVVILVLTVTDFRKGKI